LPASLALQLTGSLAMPKNGFNNTENPRSQRNDYDGWALKKHNYGTSNFYHKCLLTKNSHPFRWLFNNIWQIVLG
jgi:hypothetical protein